MKKYICLGVVFLAFVGVADGAENDLLKAKDTELAAIKGKLINAHAQWFEVRHQLESERRQHKQEVAQLKARNEVLTRRANKLSADLQAERAKRSRLSEEEEEAILASDEENLNGEAVSDTPRAQAEREDRHLKAKIAALMATPVYDMGRSGPVTSQLKIGKRKSPAD